MVSDVFCVLSCWQPEVYFHRHVLTNSRNLDVISKYDSLVLVFSQVFIELAGSNATDDVSSSSSEFLTLSASYIQKHKWNNIKVFLKTCLVFSRIWWMFLESDDDGCGGGRTGFSFCLVCPIFFFSKFVALSSKIKKRGFSWNCNFITNLYFIEKIKANLTHLLSSFPTLLSNS